LIVIAGIILLFIDYFKPRKIYIFLISILISSNILTWWLANSLHKTYISDALGWILIVLPFSALSIVVGLPAYLIARKTRKAD
jgi:hypothetical protein